MQTSNASAAFPPNNQTPSPFDLPPASITNTYDLHTNQPDNTSIYSADSNKDFDQSSPTLQIDDSIFTNKGMLKDLETLIGNMEQNQQNQNEQVLRSIKDMLQNLKQDKSSIDDYDMESMRILTKSPITSQKHKKHQNQASLENNADGETDVKNFVWKHIQDIVPNLVQQVEMELMEDTMEEDKNTTDNDENQTEKDMQETVASPEEIIPPPPPPVDQDEFLMEEVIKPNLKNASIREELPPQYLYTAEIAPFQLAFDKALQREHKPEFVLESLRGALKRIFKMFKATEAPKQLDTEASSTEVEWSEPPLPIVPSNLSTSEAEVTLPEIPVETNMQATTYVGAENVRQAIEISAPSQASVLDKKEISQSTDIAKAFSSPPSPKVQNQTMSQPSTEIVIDTALRSSPESDNHARQETNEEPKQNMINFGTSEAVNHVGSPNPTNIDIIAQSPSPISSTGALKQATELQSKENVDEKEVRSSLNETVELPPTDTTSLMQTAHSSVTSQDDTQSSNEVLRDDSIIANEATPNPAPEATLEINSNQISNDQLQAESPIVELPREDVSQNVDSTSTTIKEESVTNEVPQDDQTSVVKETLSGIETEPQDIPSNILESIPQPSTSSVSEKTSNPIEKTINQKHTMANNQKKTSKIPVRRTASNKNLILNVQVNANTEVPQQESQKVETNTRSITPEIPDQHPMDENEDTDEEELYSLESDESITELDSRADDMVSPTDTESRLFDVQSPTSTNEMFLMIHNGMESGMEESTIVPSTSSSTVHSAISFASGLKSPTEFVPSGDPSKQNLSELVMDTQRLIKQMKDEIQIEDFESSTDEDDYTDDYSDIYDDDEMGEEEEYDEDGEEEEGDGDGEEEWEDDIDEEDEYADVIGDMTEDLQQSQANTPDPGHREEHNISALSNASQSSTHTQSLSSEHFVDENSTAQENLTNSSNPSTNSMAYVETENREPEIPVETAAELQLQIATGEEEDAVLQENSSTIVIGDIPNEPQIVQPIVKQSLPMATENEVELPLQIAAEDEEGAVEVPLENTNTIAIGDIPNEPQISQPSVKESLPISIENDVETENSLPELPTEIVLAPITQTLPLQTENAIPEVPVEVVLQTITEKSPSEIVINQTTNESFAPSTSDPSTSSPTSLNNDHEMPSTSGINNKQNANESVQDDDKLSSSKQTTKQNQKSTGSKKKTNEDGKTSGNKKSNTASKIPKPKDSSKDQKPKTNDNQNETKSKTITNEEAHTKETSTPTKAKTEPKKMLPTRSKSFSGPPTPIGITSVKTITQRFQTQPKSTKPQTLKAPTTVARKPSITEAINKLTKPSTSSQLPTTSSLFRARTQPRIPKKKYHETCFSDDDYETTSSEEEPEPLEIRQRKMSVPVFRAYPNLQEPEEVKTEELVEKFMKEELVNTIAEAQIAAALISMKFQQDVSLWAAKECSDLDHAVALLKQDCELCSGTYALNEIVSMLKCTHKCCKQCAKTYFTVQITERSINDCNCPFCKMPELDNQTEHEDDNLEYFSNLDIFLKSIVEPDVHELFQRKLRDRTLLKDPNFKWCVQCSSGFFARPKQKRLICPDCGSVTCAFCRKPWHKQHEGISCEKYLEWEQNNDPNVQDIGVQQHLEQNGIDCPKCKFRYSLARGGCMHFTCTQCKFEFCYGCAKPFMMGAKCTISPYCAKLGLHAHHPRNCLFYLRDKLPVQLQILLKNNNVEYDVDPIEVNDGTEASTSQKQPALCPIPIQKETPNGLVDTKCKNDVPDKHAGMCRTHYVEYLTAKVAKAKIDPLPIFDLTDCVQELRRRGIPLPDRGPWDTDEIYKNMCAEVIQKLIPLDSK
ncbi:E3 ubiquitin-protein ligase lubel-like [Haematobia irritans]|uniref:E3 ubiquitin-protein ligase lubel-like n=1 Tax=Haematobia irritans TaxID=7368 RepID=UPI003F503BF9